MYSSKFQNRPRQISVHCCKYHVRYMSPS